MSGPFRMKKWDANQVRCSHPHHHPHVAMIQLREEGKSFHRVDCSDSCSVTLFCIKYSISSNKLSLDSHVGRGCNLKERSLDGDESEKEDYGDENDL